MHFNQKNFHKNLCDTELLKQTILAAKTEKSATLALLDYLVEVDARKLYASVNGCSSLFDYLVTTLGFSHPAAAERVNTVRLIRAVPPVKEHLETGKLTLTSAAQIQRFMNAEQKVHPKRKSVSSKEKNKVVEACLGKSKREVEKTLFEKHSEPARGLIQEKVRLVSATRSEIKFTVDENTLKKLQDLKDLLGNLSLENIFDQALDALISLEKRKRGVILAKSIDANLKSARATSGNSNTVYDTTVNDTTVNDISVHPSPTPKFSTHIKTNAYVETNAHIEADALQGTPADLVTLKSRTEAQLNSRFIPIDLKRFVFARSHGRCEFIDPRTKARCRSTFRLQLDHKLPVALGGKTEASNLRHLCSAHNLWLAAQSGLLKANNLAAKH